MLNSLHFQGYLIIDLNINLIFWLHDRFIASLNLDPLNKLHASKPKYVEALHAKDHFGAQEHWKKQALDRFSVPSSHFSIFEPGVYTDQEVFT